MSGATPKPDDAELVVERQSASTWVVALICNGNTLSCDVHDLRREKGREEAIARILCAAPALDRADLTHRLLQHAAQPFDAPATSGASSAMPTWVASFFPPVEPWPERVAGDAMLAEIASELRRLLVLPMHGAEVIATYCALSYIIDLFDVAPRLILKSPRKRCGKSRTLNAIAGACRRAIKAENLTSAVLYRLLDAASPVLLLDECDAWFAPKVKNGDDSIRGIVNSGFEKPALVLRCEGEDSKPTPFSCFGLVVMASIGKLPETVEDRAIVLPMRRRAPGEHVDRAGMSEVRRRMAAFAPKLLRWADDNRQALGAMTVDPPAGIDDRAIDVWEPLLKIGAVAGASWFERLGAAAVGLAGGRDSDDAIEDDHGLRLLADLRDAFAEKPDAKHLETETLLARLKGLPDRPWHSWSDGKGLTSRSLSKALRAFEIRPRDVTSRLGGCLKGYRRADLEPAWSAYLALGSAIPREPAPHQGCALADGVRPEDRSASRQAAQDLGSRGIADTQQGESDAAPSQRSREPGEDDDEWPPSPNHAHLPRLDPADDDPPPGAAGEAGLAAVLTNQLGIAYRGGSP